MNLSASLKIAMEVIKDSRVIVAAVVFVISISFANYVIKYKKKPPAPKVKKSIVAAPKAEEKPEPQPGEASAAEGKDS